MYGYRKGAPTLAKLIAQYPVCAVTIDGAGAVLKACAMIGETLREFEIYYANRPESVFILLSSVNIVQYQFSCGSVVMVGTSKTRELTIEFIELYSSFTALW
jgi:hypothetical protein